jgi:hypothetical protein
MLGYENNPYIEEHAQDGRGIKRPAERASEFRFSLAARSRALWILKKHAQDGRGIKRSAERASEFRFSLAARSRALCTCILLMQPSGLSPNRQSRI